MAKTVGEIRRENLRRVVDTHYGGVMRRLAVALNVQQIQLSRIYSKNATSRREIGNDLARNIEAVAGLPRGWMDQVHDDRADAIYDQLSRLDDRDRDAVEALIRSLLGRR